MKPIRALVVDDEPLARERVVALLEGEDDFEIVAQCKNGKEAVASLKQRSIDVVFLDVQMPEMDGFAALQKIPAEKIPFVIFTTAYDTFALKAFEVNAIDYLLKPFDRKRFKQALDRVRSLIHSQNKALYSTELLESLRLLVQKKTYPERIVMKSEGKIWFLPVKEIEWMESEANYIRIHSKKESHTLRETVTNMAARVDPGIFLRIHRSIIVNIEFIKEIQPWLNDDYIAVLKDGTQLSIGRTYKKEVLSALKAG